MDMDKYGNMMLKLWDSGLPILRQSQRDFACPNTARLKFPSKVQKKLDETASQAAKARSASGDGEQLRKGMDVFSMCSAASKTVPTLQFQHVSTPISFNINRVPLQDMWTCLHLRGLSTWNDPCWRHGDFLFQV